jgi:hypothetical protein
MSNQFKMRDGRIVQIDIDDDYTVTVSTVPEGKEVGRMEFQEIESPEPSPNCLRLTWAYLNKLDKSYLRQGIGGEVLRLVQDVSGLGIIASDDDGRTKQDGSHLTGDAPAFVRRMREKGLISKTTDDR